MFTLVLPCWTPNFVAILYISRHISTSGLAAAILDLSFPVTSIKTGVNRSDSRIHCLMCYKRFLSNNVHLILTGYCMQYRDGYKNLPIIVEN